MDWGGNRQGAGRKKNEIKRKTHWIRLSDDEWHYLTRTLDTYRQGAANKNMTMQYRNAPDNAPNDAAILAHMENLLSQLIMWYTEYAKYLSVEHYKKYTLDEIQTQIDLLRLQVMTLLPHLKRHGYSGEVKDAFSADNHLTIDRKRLMGFGHDYTMKVWQELEELDYHEYDLRLLGTYRFLKSKLEIVSRTANTQES